MLELSNLCVRYGHIRALEGVSLTLKAGEALAVAGMNGAGKSSLVRAICGLVPVREGQVRLDGQAITGRPLHRLEGVALVPEGRVLAPSLSVSETLWLGAGRVSARTLAARRDGVLARFPELAGRLTQRAGTLSGGEATMLALARGLMAAPRILILDEPSLGLSPAATARVFDTLAELRQDGIGVLIVEQNLHLALGFADRFLLLQHGRPVGEGSTAEADRSAGLEELLLGH
ncbi:ABC transporter ATP-binding protein [Ruegeria marina]|uniref:Branched-chain amino acid transport system ATP-binding protein n=1 Tax=Ruegeria marina TaxID=639004 RepID=A0A1G6TBN7_9RHOB|nr:ABC transporter ATP-binding protein [Ruegeria marina]SDD26490.1 branched-chain amino acid transport system ATP-binding protein [Ruegeria marina]